MYAGVLTLIAGPATWFESLRLTECAGFAFLLMHAFVFFYEEPALKRKFGEKYEPTLKQQQDGFQE